MIFKIIIVLCFVGACSTHKCVTRMLVNNGEEHIKCRNVGSLIEVADESGKSWKSVQVINSYNDDTEFLVSDLPNGTLTNLIELDLSAVRHVRIIGSGFSQFKSLQVLKLSFNNLKEVHRDWFPKTLRVLDFSGNRLTKKRIQELGSIPGLKNLTMNLNDWPEIFRDDFDGMPLLEYLDLKANNINSIEPDTFASVPNVKWIDLSANLLINFFSFTVITEKNELLESLSLCNNQISELNPRKLRHLRYLQNLDLSINELENINKSHFEGLTSLKRLNLEWNKIHYISEGTFEPLIALETLDLGSNSVQTIPTLFFGRSGFKLKELRLSFNKLVSLPPNFFQPIPNLLTVDLSVNKLVEFDENLFRPLIKIEKLILSWNEIIEIPENAFEMFRTLSVLHLDYNLLTYLRLYDAILVSLREIRIGSNPWQCACLDDILRIIGRSNISYLHELDWNGLKPICVETNKRYCQLNIHKTIHSLLYDIHRRYV